MNSKEWADAAIENLKRVADVAAAIPAQNAAVPHSTGSPAAVPALDPHAVAEALAEAMKSNNSTTQAIAIRANNLSTLYPDKAA